MIRCPGCTQERVIVRVDGTGRSRCLDCGTTWVQVGADQRRIRVRRVPQPERDTLRFVVDWA